MQDKIEQLLLSIISVLAVVISILDLFGVLENITFLANKIPTITLLAVALVMGQLVLERRGKLNEIEGKLQETHISIMNSAEQVIRSLNGVDIHRFSDSQEVYKYVARRIKEARRTIDDLTWGPAERERTPAAQQAFERYVETISTVCTAKRHIAYREVMSFPPVRHIERARILLEKNLFGYRLRYYNFRAAELPPLLSFMVIDSEEVIIAFYRAPFLPAEREMQIAVKHPDIVKLFQDYYDAIWQGAKPLKEEGLIGIATLAEVDSYLNVLEVELAAQDSMLDR